MILLSIERKKSLDIDPKKRRKTDVISNMFWGDGQQHRGVLHQVGDVIEQVFRPTIRRQETLLQQIVEKLDRSETTGQELSRRSDAKPVIFTPPPIIVTDQTYSLNNTETTAMSSMLNRSRNNMINPYWSDLPWLGKESVIGFLHTEEITFWQQILSKYLAPLDKDAGEERRIQIDLINLRNNAGFAFFMLNAIWIILQFQCEYVATQFNEIMIDIGRAFGKEGTKVQVLGLLFMLFFASCMIVQFLTMILHRWGTFIEILASTKLFEKHRKYKLKPGSNIVEMTSQEVAEVLKDLDIEVVVPSTNNATAKDSVVFEMEPSMNTGHHAIDEVDDQEDDDFSDEQDVYNEPPIDYFDHPVVQDAADESRLRPN